MKQPRLLTLQRMFDVLSQDNKLPAKHFFKDGFGVVINMTNFLDSFIRNGQGPYLLEDYRIGYIRQGYMHGIINLQEYTITAGHLVFITPGTIVEPLDVSTDFLILGMGVPADMFHIAHDGRLPDLFGGKQKHGILAVSEEEELLTGHMFRMLCEIAAAHGDSKATHHMMAAITAHYDSLFASHQSPAPAGRTATDIFDRFIRLVNEHCCEEHRLAFYADRICLTERYLGTVIRQTSGITAKEWIDKAVITAAKVRLRHGDKPVALISEELHFPNPSFFCKYFKRLTGCTPQEYRAG